jgi:hypothetical protein
MPDYSKVPQELKDCRCWVVTRPTPDLKRPGKLKKLPVSVITGSGDDWNLEKNLGSFEQALEFCRTHEGYIPGFAFEHSPYLGVDIDSGCEKNGLPKPAAQAVLAEFADNHYCELSPSSTGYRCFIKRTAALPAGTKERQAYKLYGGCTVEIFSGGFCTVTGRAISQSASVLNANPIDVFSWCQAKKQADAQADEAGGRNNGLASYAGKLVKKGLSYQEAKDLIIAANQNLAEPLSLADLESTVLSSLRKWIEDAGSTKSEPLPSLVVLSATELLRYKFEERPPIFTTPNNSPVFHQASINQIHAWRGVGKTNFATGIGSAAARGEQFLAWKANGQFPVLYVEGELPGAELQERIMSQVRDCDNYYLITPEAQPNSMIPPLTDPRVRDLVEEAVVKHGIKILFLDSISTLANIPTNDEDNWLALCAWFRVLRNKYHLANFFLHHDGKSGMQRGHSKVEDLLDKSVQLTWENGYQGADGLKFTLRFDKARQPVKETNFLEVEWDNELGWAYRDRSAEDKKKKALEMIAADKRSVEICRELHISKTTLSNWRNEGKQQPELPLEESSEEAF